MKKEVLKTTAQCTVEGTENKKDVKKVKGLEKEEERR
jgi:hypothetical protein